MSLCERVFPGNVSIEISRQSKVFLPSSVRRNLLIHTERAKRQKRGELSPLPFLFLSPFLSLSCYFWGWDKHFLLPFNTEFPVFWLSGFGAAPVPCPTVLRSSFSGWVAPFVSLVLVLASLHFCLQVTCVRLLKPRIIWHSPPSKPSPTFSSSFLLSILFTCHSIVYVPL